MRPSRSKSDGIKDMNSSTSISSKINYKKVDSVEPKFSSVTEDDDSENNETFSPLFRQILAASGPIAVTIASGMTSGYSAILLPQLAVDNSTIHVSKEEESWIASMAPLPMALGCCLGGLLMERFGRRTSHLITAPIYLVGWLLFPWATSTALLLSGRFITGLCVGLLGPPSSVYIAECSAPRYRGILLAAISLAIAVGLFLAHLLGTFFTWQVTAICCATLPILGFVLCFLVPESPTWLMRQDRLGDANRAFYWFRGKTVESRAEFHNMVVQHNSTQTGDDGNSGGGIDWRMYTRAEFLKPLAILSLFFITTQCAGNNAVAFYSVSIMQETVGHMDRYVAMLAIDTVRVIISVIACVLLKRYPRRLLALVSGLGTAISLFSLSTYLYLAQLYPEAVQTFNVIPILALAGYIVFISVGLVPLPWAMTGELFALRTKGVGSGITTSSNFLAFFVVVKTSPGLFGSLGAWGTFLVYGGAALVGTVVLAAVLPETSGKTLQEIEEGFRRSSSGKASASASEENEYEKRLNV